jgi:hypothetical protein
MNYAASVRVGECPCDFAHQARSVDWRKRPLRSKPLSQGFAFNVAHDEEDEAVRFTHAMDRDDVWMRESGRGARLLHEPFARSGEAREMHREDLDGDVTIQLDVARQVDDSHSAAADLALQGILSGKCGLELEEFEGGLRHGCCEFAVALW